MPVSTGSSYLKELGINTSICDQLPSAMSYSGNQGLPPCNAIFYLHNLAHIAFSYFMWACSVATQ